MSATLVIVTLVASLMGCAAGTAASQTGTPPAQTPATEWRVEVMSQGGLTGRGAGGVVATADGTLQVLGPGGARQATCTLELTPAQTAVLTHAVAAAQPSTWAKRYAPRNNPQGCCDEITWTLRLSRRTAAGTTEQRTVSWVSEREAQLPRDLATLRTELLALAPPNGCPR